MGSESAGVGSRLAIGKVRVETDGGQGATKVNEDDIIGVVREYIEDKENSYALMLTGEWGCGKTYFVEHALTEKLEEDESRHPVVVASAYGAKDLAELCGAIESGFISKFTRHFVIGRIWHIGISSEVLFAPIIPAVVATPSTSPFPTVPASIAS